MALASGITLKQLQEFHNIDRHVFARLIKDLGVDAPLPAMKIVAFWNLVERSGFRNFIKNLQQSSDELLFSLAEEAAMGLKHLYSSSAEEYSPWLYVDFPVMRGFLGQEISWAHLFKDRESAKRMIDAFVEDVCQIAFLDIVETNLGVDQESSNSNPSSGSESQSSDEGEEKVGILSDDETAKVNTEDRTLFVTFSRGHPVSYQELRGFIVGKFGRCVEAINMDPNPRPVFAFIVLKSLSDMSRIIGGKHLIKCFIHGKEVRVRKFLPKTVKQSHFGVVTAKGFPIKAS